MSPILALAPQDDDDCRAASRAYRASLHRDERWPVCPLRSAMWDYGLVALGVICTSILLVAQYA